MKRKRIPSVFLLGSLLALLAAVPAASDDFTSCKMDFDLKGWSALYKTAKGNGTITCENGETAEVRIQTKGGGLTFGKTEIVNGRGTFSPVIGIAETFGSYAQAEAHAGAAKSAGAQAMTRGDVSLSLAGTGRGASVGFSFGKFTIEPLEPPEPAEPVKTSELAEPS